MAEKTTIGEWKTDEEAHAKFAKLEARLRNTSLIMYARHQLRDEQVPVAVLAAGSAECIEGTICTAYEDGMLVKTGSDSLPVYFMGNNAVAEKNNYCLLKDGDARTLQFALLTGRYKGTNPFENGEPRKDLRE